MDSIQSSNGFNDEAKTLASQSHYGFNSITSTPEIFRDLIEVSIPLWIQFNGLKSLNTVSVQSSLNPTMDSIQSIWKMNICVPKKVSIPLWIQFNITLMSGSSNPFVSLNPTMDSIQSATFRKFIVQSIRLNPTMDSIQSKVPNLTHPTGERSQSHYGFNSMNLPKTQWDFDAESQSHYGFNSMAKKFASTVSWWVSIPLWIQFNETTTLQKHSLTENSLNPTMDSIQWATAGICKVKSCSLNPTMDSIQWVKSF